ncbi:hypothetical protein LguiB_020284 [Lonicera macranthoides]
MTPIECQFPVHAFLGNKCSSQENAPGRLPIHCDCKQQIAKLALVVTEVLWEGAWQSR